MKRFLFKLLFSLSSFTGILIFFLVNKDTHIPIFDFGFDENILWLKYLIIFIIAFLYAYLVLFFSRYFLWNSDTLELLKEIKKNDGTKKVIRWEIKPAEWIFLPVYIWLFVVALELWNPFSLEIWILVFFLFTLWFFFEGVSYFNPFFLFFWYRFYELKDVNNISYMLITRRKDLKEVINLDKLTRINNFTYLEYKMYD